MNQLSALADPTRFRIIEILLEHDESAGDLSSRFQLSQPAVSRHLRILREFGFVTVRTDGQRRIYSLEHGPLNEIDTWLSRYRQLWAQRLDALEVEVHHDAKYVHPPQPEAANSSTTKRETTT